MRCTLLSSAVYGKANDGLTLSGTDATGSAGDVVTDAGRADSDVPAARCVGGLHLIFGEQDDDGCNTQAGQLISVGQIVGRQVDREALSIGLGDHSGVVAILGQVVGIGKAVAPSIGLDDGSKGLGIYGTAISR